MAELIGELTECPRCGSAWQKAIAFNGAESEFWYECSNPGCNSWYNSYKPLPHQYAFHKDAHTFVANFGGYGTGKTTTSREEAYKHFFITPKGNTLIGANVSSQYEQTIKREIEADLPAAFVKGYSTQKSTMDLINDHRILYRPFDDVDKLRSYNLSQFIMIEASECPPDAFTQLRTRLRNTAASIYKYDEHGDIVTKTVQEGMYEVDVPDYDGGWQKGIIESNPANAWIKYDILLASDEIHPYGDVYDAYEPFPEGDRRRNKDLSTYVVSTSANPYLPEDFAEKASQGKPSWWAARFLHSSFTYSEARVYPSAEDVFVDSFDIPKHWKRAVAHDYGLSDPSTFVFLAINEVDNEVFVYKEASTNNKSVADLAALFKAECADIPQGMMAFTPLIDPVSGFKRDPQLKTLAELYLDYGIVFSPGYKDITARIFRLNTYMETGTLKIFKDKCPDLCDELVRYTFTPDDKRMSGYSDKPVDKNNHRINALEWLAMALPRDPSNLYMGVYNKHGDDISQIKENEKKRVTYADHVFADDKQVDLPTPYGIDLSDL